MYCKGADSVVERLLSPQSEFLQDTKNEVDVSEEDAIHTLALFELFACARFSFLHHLCTRAHTHTHTHTHTRTHTHTHAYMYCFCAGVCP